MAKQDGEKAEVVDHVHRDEAHDAVQLVHEIESQQVSPWTPSMFRLYGVLAFAYLCGCLVRALSPRLTSYIMLIK